MNLHMRLPEVEELLATITPDTKEVTRIKRDALRQMHRQVMRQSSKPDQQSDQFVDWNFNRNWETQDLPLGVPAGTDYDYFSAVLGDCITMFRQHGFPSKTDPDLPGYRAFGGLESGQSYSSLYAVWQNGQRVSSYSGLRGPWVDFGPTADYAIFLEKSVTKQTNNMGAPLLFGVGVLHAIAERLQTKYARTMTIFAHTQKPEGGSEVAVPRKHRKTPVWTFPVIRIMTRHYRGGRRG